MYTITSFEIDERCLTPGGIGRAKDKGLDIEALTKFEQASISGGVFIYVGKQLDYFTVDNILRWGMGEALGDKCFVILDSKVRMTFNEYWTHGNAYHNYIAMTQDSAFGEGSSQAARPDFERAILVYTAHDIEVN